MAPKKVLAMVLAGGEGKRLMPLTADRAKPAVPFGGQYRLIDFILSNIVNSGYLQAVVLTQYKSHSLDKHISKTWRMSALLQNYVTPVPAQQRKGPHWFLGSADAIYQSLNLIQDENPDYVLVVGADNIFRMDFSQMVDAHIRSGRSLSVAAIRQPIELSDQFGIIETDEADPTKIKAFVEKPESTPGLPDDPSKILASMGNYVFTTEALIEAVTRDAENPDSKHDMGGSIVPMFVEQDDATVYDFIHNDVPGSTDRDRDYWRDVGTIDAFYDANMDLISINPVFNLYNNEWPLYTARTNYPPAKFVHAGPGRIGQAVDSYVAQGVVVSGATIQGSILSPGSYFHSWSSVTESVVMDRVQVGRHSQIHRAIIDKDVVIPPRTQIGLDREHDLARGFHVTASGITVVGKGKVIQP